jgi:hypothetical protein
MTQQSVLTGLQDKDTWEMEDYHEWLPCPVHRCCQTGGSRYMHHKRSIQSKNDYLKSGRCSKTVKPGKKYWRQVK